MNAERVVLNLLYLIIALVLIVVLFRIVGVLV